MFVSTRQIEWYKNRLLRPMMEEHFLIKRLFWMRMEYIWHICWYNFYIRRPRERNRTLKFMSWADEKSTSKPESWWRWYFGPKKTPKIKLCVVGPYHIPKSSFGRDKLIGKKLGRCPPRWFTTRDRTHDTSSFSTKLSRYQLSGCFYLLLSPTVWLPVSPSLVPV